MAATTAGHAAATTATTTTGAAATATPGFGLFGDKGHADDRNDDPIEY